MKKSRIRVGGVSIVGLRVSWLECTYDAYNAFAVQSHPEFCKS